MSAGGAPAPTWRAMAAAHPLVGWRDAQVAALARMMQRAVANWAAAWGVTEDLLPVRCASAGEHDASQPWELLGVAQDAAAWFALRPSFHASLADALWTVPRADTPIAREVLAACGRELLAQLAAAAGLQRGQPDAQQAWTIPAGYWSGAVVAELGPHASLLLDARVVRALARAAAPQGPTIAVPALATVTEAISSHAVSLQVHLGECEMDVAGLRDLELGDVVRLPHPVDVPLQVRDASGRPLFDAFLARRGSFKAVELASPAAACGAASERALP